MFANVSEREPRRTMSRPRPQCGAAEPPPRRARDFLRRLSRCGLLRTRLLLMNVRTILALGLVALLACGSEPAPSAEPTPGTGSDGGPEPALDGGAPTSDGGGPSNDGGVKTDGGSVPTGPGCTPTGFCFE